MNASHGVPAGTQLRNRVDQLQRQLATLKTSHTRTKATLKAARAEIARLRRQIRWMEKSAR